ncbi:unnamed protein product (macronuclear) [Paramecium tetraurelia]|uniref:Transmembrane protein n=1 Tax=Paramecium tetraurelia TaxID=5888 RepID=A0CEC8_PARTE|nr:uncharacterized protein GSPATT00037582001 [Paramecium tetraurelia]CAK69145.1 unnamed protein product [Paramecium tetraurelia]|eukprot:XP_001436542.1 hypothetical protein (macronuclear) [Paramecium tetraurelia strain d4-2]
MIDQFVKGLQKIDRFGAIYRPPIIDIHPEYKSVLGGIATFILYGSSLAYFLYQIIQWQSNQLLPKITYIQTSYEKKYYNIDEMLSTFYIRKNNKVDQIDPFDPGNIILQPVLSKFENQQLVDSYPCEYRLQDNNDIYEVILKNIELNLNMNYSDDDPQIEYLLSFGTCMEIYLLDGQKCANQSLVNTYMNQKSHAIILNHYVKEYNSKQKRIQNVTKQFLGILTSNSTLYFQNQIRLSKTEVDDGFLFPSNSNKEFPMDVIIISQTTSTDSFYNVFGRATYLVMAYSLSEVIQEQYIEYPKISEVLADIGSIVSIILVLSYLFIFLNEHQLEKESISKVIQMYYPEYCNIQQSQNWYGKIVEVKYNNIIIDKDEYISFYNKIQRIAAKKLSITNILYTLAKLQFLLQSTYPSDKIKLAHKVGIKLKQFSKISTPEIIQEQLNLQEISRNQSNDHIQIHDISNVNQNEQNNNQSSMVQQETINKDNSKSIFLKLKDEFHLLSDEDFQLFTIDEPITIDDDIQKSDIYFENNYIDL